MITKDFNLTNVDFYVEYMVTDPVQAVRHRSVYELSLIHIYKYLADMGKGTRTELKEMIRKGRIKVNGEVVKKPETKIRKGEDTILLDNAPVEYVELEYYLLNKPQGVISATEDRRRETVVDLIDEKQRKDLFPVGRLDIDTEGLLLITNDGADVYKRQILNRPVRAMVVGIPNVGKSTFINSFAGKAAAKTGNKPGVTKGNQWIRLNKQVELLDTPGILWPKFEDQKVGLLLAFLGSINDEILEKDELASELAGYLKEITPGDVYKRQARIGATGTHFANANGLTNEDHYMTAYDLYLMFHEALKYEKFRDIIGTKTYTASYKGADGSDKTASWSVSNYYMLGKREMPDGLSVFGGKTGTTKAAGYCLIMGEKDADGKEYASVVMLSLIHI